MYCPTCGKPNPADATFCASCGNVFPGKQGVAGTTVPPPRAAETVPPRPGVTPRVGEVKIGLFAGRYELQNVLGKGGMGVVYRAKDNELGEDIAVKLLQPQFTKDAHEVERFKREILTARRITHPNVIRIHDYGTNGDEFFISMELLSGGTLADRIAAGVSLADAREIAVGVAEGLGAAHAKKVVHRDIKPHNVLFDADGTAKLVDFGIARFATATRATRGFAGTPHYISPEQAKGEDATERSDVYSLGVLLFELFTGKLPFDADSLVALAVKHAHDPPPPPRSLRPDLPEALEKIVLHCLEKDPAKRYQTPGDLATDLRALDLGAGAAPLPAGPAPARPTPSAISSATPPPASIAPFAAPVSLREPPSPAITPAPGLTYGGGPTPRPQRRSGCFVFFVFSLLASALACGGLFTVGFIEELGKPPSPTPSELTGLDIGIGDDDDDANSPPSKLVPLERRPVASPPQPPPPPPAAANRYVSPAGWTFEPTSNWTYVNESNGYVLYQDEDASTKLWVVYAPGFTMEQLREFGAQAFLDPLNGARLMPTGEPSAVAAGRGLAIDYHGYIGSVPLAGRGAAVPVSGGVVTLLGFGPADQSVSTRLHVDTLSSLVRNSASTR